MEEEANILFKEKKFQLASAQYTKLIEFDSTNGNHFVNRSACYMMMGQYQNALTDANKAVDVNPTYIKAHEQLINCAFSLGNFIKVKAALAKLAEVDPSNSLIKSERKKITEIQDYLQKEVDATLANNLIAALTEINKSLSICTHSICFKVRKGEYLALLHKYKDAETIANEILAVDKNNAEAKYILCLCIYLSDVKKAVNYLEDMLRSVPDHQKIMELYQKAKLVSDKKDEGNDAFRRGDYEEAYNLYEEAMKIDPNNPRMKMILYNNKAQASRKLRKAERSIEECRSALAIDSQYVKVLKLRAKCYLVLDRWDEAFADLKRAAEISREDPSNKTKRQTGATNYPNQEIIEIRRTFSLLRQHLNAKAEREKQREEADKNIAQAVRLSVELGGLIDI